MYLHIEQAFASITEIQQAVYMVRSYEISEFNTIKLSTNTIKQHYKKLSITPKLHQKCCKNCKNERKTYKFL